MNKLSLAEYAEFIGAELKPTCLADMPVMEERGSDNTFFGGLGYVQNWLDVKDPSGGLNKSGVWPFSVQKKRDGDLVIVASTY